MVKICNKNQFMKISKWEELFLSIWSCPLKKDLMVRKNQLLVSFFKKINDGPKKIHPNEIEKKWFYQNFWSIRSHPLIIIVRRMIRSIHFLKLDFLFRRFGGSSSTFTFHLVPRKFIKTTVSFTISMRFFSLSHLILITIELKFFSSNDFFNLIIDFGLN